MKEVEFNHGVEQIRAVAIAAVFFAHTLFVRNVLREIGAPFSANALGYGVMLFFIISGYLIFKTLYSNNFDLKTFYIKRVFRLYPTIVVAIIMAEAAFFSHQLLFKHPPYPLRQMFNEGITVIAALYSIYLYIYNTAANTYVGMNGFTHFWSLSVEEQFYIIFSSSMSLYSLFTKKISVWALSFACIAFIIVINYKLYEIFGKNSLLWGFMNYLHAWHTEYLFAGVILGVLEVSGVFDKIKSKAKRVPRVAMRPIVFVLIFGPFILISYYEFQGNRVVLRQWEEHIYISVRIIFLLGVWIITLGFDIFEENSLFGKAAKYIGKRSYVIYMIHPPLRLFAWIFAALNFPQIFKQPLEIGLWIFVGTLILTLPISEVIHRYVEGPLNRKGHQISQAYALKR